jgi:hypothetical protein
VHDTPRSQTGMPWRGHADAMRYEGGETSSCNDATAAVHADTLRSTLETVGTCVMHGYVWPGNQRAKFPFNVNKFVHIRIYYEDTSSWDFF